MHVAEDAFYVVVMCCCRCCLCCCFLLFYDHNFSFSKCLGKQEHILGSKTEVREERKVPRGTCEESPIIWRHHCVENC
jgi:hypothetical protein